jgi:hypothetical protein
VANTCCQLVGNLTSTVPGLISISHRIGTEASRIGGDQGALIIGATIGTVTITAYANKVVHIGCPGRASLNVPWIRKYDCSTGITYFIFSGQGQSSVSGNVGGLASPNEFINSYAVLSASASSGPASIYESAPQEDGYGLSYKGTPFTFTTSDQQTLSINIGFGYGAMYLQSFSLQCTPGQVPISTYDFIFSRNITT